MPVEAISTISPLSGYTVVAPARRSPEVTPDAREVAEQENDARRIAEAVRGASPAYLSGPDGQSIAVGGGTRVNIIAVPADPEGTMRSANAIISRAYSEGEPSPEDMRMASEAYRAEAAAQDDLARRRQGNGLRTLDILA